MAFNIKQRRSLTAKLKYRHVKTRSSQGATLSYLEGWHVIAEANRIFGYDCWDRKTLSPRCVWSERQAGQVAAFYTTKVRITVRAGGETIGYPEPVVRLTERAHYPRRLQVSRGDEQAGGGERNGEQRPRGERQRQH